MDENFSFFQLSFNDVHDVRRRSHDVLLVVDGVLVQGVWTHELEYELVP